MKKFIVLTLVTAAFSMSAQNQNDIFQDAFDGMFDFEIPNMPRSGAMDNPPPPVPLDGGIIALLAAGGAIGYRKVAKNKEEV